MIKLLFEWWIQIWPNLAAGAIQLPIAFAWHHRKMKKHNDNLVSRLQLLSGAGDSASGDTGDCSEGN